MLPEVIVFLTLSCVFPVKRHGVTEGDRGVHHGLVGLGLDVVERVSELDKVEDLEREEHGQRDEDDKGEDDDDDLANARVTVRVPIGSMNAAVITQDQAPLMKNAEKRGSLISYYKFFFYFKRTSPFSFQPWFPYLVFLARLAWPKAQIHLLHKYFPSYFVFPRKSPYRQVPVCQFS